MMLTLEELGPLLERVQGGTATPQDVLEIGDLFDRYAETLRDYREIVLGTQGAASDALTALKAGDWGFCRERLEMLIRIH